MAGSGSNKKDFYWKYTKVLEGEKYFRCIFCDQLCSGTINRFKNHLAGTHQGIKPCSKVPEDIKQECCFALASLKELKDKRNDFLDEVRMGIGSRSMSESFSSPTMEDGMSPFGSGSGSGNSIANITRSTSLSKPPKVRGPMDKFTSSQPRQTTLNNAYKQQERKEACRKLGRWIFSKGLSFNVVNDPYFLPACESIAKYGPGFKPPTAYELRTWILRDEVAEIDSNLEVHKEIWKEYGCSIMSDGWTDGKNRCLINFLVNSPAGTWFLKSIDASDTIKTGELMFNYLDKVIEEVGEENVVQIITDNASNYVNAGKRLMEKRKRLFWTPCAAHCIDLMLEDIGKLKIHTTTLHQAKQVVKFIYGHTGVLSMMRSFTKNQELLRPAVTRFSTAYLTLQSIYKQKVPLQAMFSSEKFTSSSWAKKVEGVKARATVLFDAQFWSHVVFCIKTVMPLVVVLREVDSEEFPAVGYIYEMMESAKAKIAFNCAGNQKKYGPIWNKIDARWTSQLHTPLHAAGYYLNPQFHYEKNFNNSEKIREGLFQCMDRMLSKKERIAADCQMDLYHKAQGEFGCLMAIETRKMRTPVNWWSRFGNKTPELQNFATRILSLTCSATGCERNWSTFEAIHTKKRNRLEHKRLNSLVYVKYNTRLRERSIMRKQENVDPLCIEEIDSDDEWIVEKEDPVLPNDYFWLSDDESDDEVLNVGAIKTIPQPTYQREKVELTRTASPSVTVSNVDSTSSAKKRGRDAISSKEYKDKGKATKSLVDESMDMEDTFHNVDLVDEDDNVDEYDIE